MLHRIFIAINLPPQIKKVLASYQKQFQKEFSSLDSLSNNIVKWILPENFHITLEFLGNMSDQGILDIGNYAKKIALKNEPFNLVLDDISFGPLGNYGESTIKTPKFIWARGQQSPELSKLFRDLDNILFIRKVTLRKGDKNLMEKEKNSSHFTPHITLARLRQWQFSKIEFDERPRVNENLDLNFRINSIQIMESQLKKMGPMYTILESVDLGSVEYQL